MKINSDQVLKCGNKMARGGPFIARNENLIAIFRLIEDEGWLWGCFFSYFMKCPLQQTQTDYRGAIYKKKKAKKKFSSQPM